MKKTIILLFAVLTTVTSYGQKYYFPKENYEDTTVFAKALSVLAEKVQEDYKGNN